MARPWKKEEMDVSTPQRMGQGALDLTNDFLRTRMEGELNRIRTQPGAGQIYQDKGSGQRGSVGEGSYWNVRADQPWDNSGLMLALANSPAVNKMKNIYSQFDPFLPNVDLDDQRVGYDFDKNLWGGTLGFGGGYDREDDDYNAYINWGANW